MKATELEFCFSQTHTHTKRTHARKGIGRKYIFIFNMKGYIIHFFDLVMVETGNRVSRN